jgi:3-methylcrotonyl-CoA carboxylase alpha subunit
MLKKILIANRGEIAVRIIKTARRLGVKTVAVVSEADRGAPFAVMADEAVEIGPGLASDSYLRIDKIIAAAKATGADGIHPGYGFLAENADFAEAVGKAGIKFIGPSPAAMRQMGGKADAKAIAAKAGVPVVPGYQGDSQTAKALAKEAKGVGYPIMIKAVAGGGGRGMRLVEREDDLAAALEGAQREAQAAFGNSAVLIEKVVVAPRHIEVQVFGDSHGNVVHLFERDCSLQRRNQKVIEEAPAPGMSPQLRAKICEAAVTCAKAVRYEGAGTVEFLVEGSIWWSGNSGSRQASACRSARTRSGCRAMPSRRDCAPRTPPMGSCLRRGRSLSSSSRNWKACASIPAWKQAR